jgi:hypothetical protein
MRKGVKTLSGKSRECHYTDLLISYSFPDIDKYTSPKKY